MKSKAIVILGVVALIVAVAAAIVSRRERPERPVDSVSKPRVLSGLEGRLDDVRVIAIKTSDGEFEVRKAGDGWEVSKGAYPARAEEVRKVLVSLAELREGEERTSKPERYAEIGVQDVGAAPEAGKPSPSLVTLKDDKGGIIASVIVGQTKYGTPQGVYLRKAGEAGSWLAEGALDLPVQATRWMNTQVVNIPRERIKNVTVTHPDGETVRISRPNGEAKSFTVHDIPEGKELKFEGAADDVGSALSMLTFDDVGLIGEIDFEGKAGGVLGSYSEFKTFDGLIVSAQVTNVNGAAWVKLSAYVDPALESQAAEEPPAGSEGETAAKAATTKLETVKKEAAELNERFSKWAFSIPQYKATAYNKRMADMLKGDAPPPPPPSMEGTIPLVPPMPDSGG